MKKPLLLIALLLFCMSSNMLFGQENQSNEENPDIYFLKYKHSKFLLLDEDGNVLKHKLKSNDLFAMFTDHEEALKHYKAYRTLKVVKYITRGVALGTMIYGWWIAEDGEGNDAGWGIMAAGGLFLVGVSIPVGIIAGSQAGKSVDEYNYLMDKEKRKYSLNLGLTQHGIGLVLNF